jgi:hypothetical protein
MIFAETNNSIALAIANTKQIKLFRRVLHSGDVMPRRAWGSIAFYTKSLSTFITTTVRRGRFVTCLTSSISCFTHFERREARVLQRTKNVLALISSRLSSGRRASSASRHLRKNRSGLCPRRSSSLRI